MLAVVLIMLTTPRLRLRQFVAADAPLLRALNDNPNVYRYVGDGPLIDDAAALEILETRVFPQYRDHGVGRWAVERASDGTFLGWCGLKWHEELGEYDLGYRFFEEHWGQGYATEAARACLTWGRERFPNARIMARVDPRNVASVRVLEKLGLVFERDAPEDDSGLSRVFVAP